MAKAKKEMQDQEEWTDAKGGLGQIIRWNEEAKNPGEEEKTIYVGLKIQGIYKAKRENVGENNSTIYEIKTEEHGALSVWSTTVLDGMFEEIPVGHEVLIECTGNQESKSGGKDYLGFNVKHRPAAMEEAGKEEEEKGEGEEGEY